MQKVLLLTPPLTQLNTPYPATAFLAGWLGSLGWDCMQADLGIDLVNRLFSRQGLTRAFAAAEQGARDSARQLDVDSLRVLALKDLYLDSIDDVMDYLALKAPTLAYRIDSRTWLPEGRRFAAIQGADETFGSMGVADRASWLATIYLEELGDFIKDAVCPRFGFSRYAERIALSPPTFDSLWHELHGPDTLCEEIYLEALDELLESGSPDLVCLSVPFPGNLFAALRMGRHIRSTRPGVAIALGGGYANTELRQVSDPRLFEFIDYLTLDDGYQPLRQILRHLDGKAGPDQLKRTFVCRDGVVTWVDGSGLPDISHVATGTPDYGPLLRHRYLQVIDMANPMHRLWSWGRWNKITLAHGCYWKRCTFCDTSLDYIHRYEMAPARILADKIEAMVKATGERGFHGTDEAAPPALMAELALELLRRKLNLTWWTNIRFDRNFSPDICRLLAASGCVAVTGGIEVAGERLLGLINKGVTLPQLAQVCRNFTEAGIMTHGYLMYGFPTQTAQETVDSLEVVRQFFQAGILQSGFWHRLSVTRHAPLGMRPDQFGIILTDPGVKPFANNDMAFSEPGGMDHDRFGPGLEKALFNYMHGLGIDSPLGEWFGFRTPRPSLDPASVELWLGQDAEGAPGEGKRVLWLGPLPQDEQDSGARNSRHKGSGSPGAGSQGKQRLLIHGRQEQIRLSCPPPEAAWVNELARRTSLEGGGPLPMADLDAGCRTATGMGLGVWLMGKTGLTLRKAGLLVL